MPICLRCKTDVSLMSCNDWILYIVSDGNILEEYYVENPLSIVDIPYNSAGFKSSTTNLSRQAGLCPRCRINME